MNRCSRIIYLCVTVNRYQTRTNTMQLVIVESPTKARKLKEYLGKGYEVTASMGHIRDLPKSKIGVDVEHDFAPEYIAVKGKGDLIKKLKASAAKASEVILAMDPDREGEAIAWHTQATLEEGKKPTKATFKRVTFHEITKQAILDAMAHPTTLDLKLVDAQQARRIVDRLVGYTLSPVLWKKVRYGLSAGRVQSVALRLIVEREDEIEAFKPVEYWEIVVDLKLTDSGEGELLQATLVKIDGKGPEKDGFLVTGGDQASSIVELLKSATYRVVAIDRKERKSQPYAPFTTSTLQQAAANTFGWSAKQTMATAQKLYEEGKITYHRTDSLNLSVSAVDQARTYILKEYGPAYLPESARLYKTKSKNAQEAHEAIRPTDVTTSEIELSGTLTEQHAKLYNLIWKRTIASQMKEAIFDASSIDIEAKSNEKTYSLRSSGSILKFDGWKKLFKRTAEDVQLPPVAVDEKLTYQELHSEQKFTQPPPRFNDASLIKSLEEKGIGRPSTYAPTISTIIDRGYVERNEKRFYPTIVGRSVIGFLKTNFLDIIDYDFTAEMEEDLDRIARGEKEWIPTTKAFWDPFKKKVDEVSQTAERVQIPVEHTGRKCPDCAEGEIIIRMGRFGKFYSCDKFPECKHTERFMESIDMICPDCGKGDVIVKKTKKGRTFYGCSTYPECSYASWNKPKPPAGEATTSE